MQLKVTRSQSAQIMESLYATSRTELASRVGEKQAMGTAHENVELSFDKKESKEVIAALKECKNTTLAHEMEKFHKIFFGRSQVAETRDKRVSIPNASGYNAADRYGKRKPSQSYGG
jgi:hypothetical protein